jgi:hypothetical protein
MPVLSFWEKNNFLVHMFVQFCAYGINMKKSTFAYSKVPAKEARPPEFLNFQGLQSWNF